LDKTAKPPKTDNFAAIRVAAKKCLVCDFAKRSTQTVFGEGSEHPLLMIVGEVPGDSEDQQGHPFVGPAGKLLRSLLTEVGIDIGKVYLTNAVKHFKFVQRGKRRLHQKPNSGEIHACMPWLAKEIAILKPQIIVALGATAAASVFGRPVKISAERSSFLISQFEDCKMIVSWHPSAILRSPDPSAKKLKLGQLKKDLQKAWRAATKK
jgi:uracil-DNA glycosylase